MRRYISKTKYWLKAIRLSPSSAKNTCKIVVAFLVLSIAGGSRESAANFSVKVSKIELSVNGRTFGTFSAKNSEEDFKSTIKSKKTFSFERNFVTDKSLYAWALNFADSKSATSDLQITFSNQDGLPLYKKTLHSASPIAWSIRSGESFYGSFFEKVSFSVQSISDEP